uniref:MSP domain-containing protein n=1 Tax=Steinernema glaseri TaxID=37863 RepID=A0A1I7YGV4_9BILA
MSIDRKQNASTKILFSFSGIRLPCPESTIKPKTSNTMIITLNSHPQPTKNQYTNPISRKLCAHPTCEAGPKVNSETTFRQKSEDAASSYHDSSFNHGEEDMLPMVRPSAAAHTEREY